LGRHTDPRIGDSDSNAAAAVAGGWYKRERDRALLGELASIAQQVQQYLPEAHLVGPDGADVIRALKFETIPVLFGEGLGGDDEIARKSREVQALLMQLYLAGLDL